MFESIGQPLDGVHLLKPTVFVDNRGDFVKTFHKTSFNNLGLHFEPVEEFFSTSLKNVIRGFHFQSPPDAHDKLVYCVKGKVLDVILDLRKGSDTYGKAIGVELSAQNKYLLYIPVGFGHGFLSLEDDSVMIYKTSTMHAPQNDFGIKWDSVDFDWGNVDPIVSKRDDSFITFNNFKSPFN
jgi:dTDP-4-dehydrorhamnose 3,5-epimerase